jgi:Zn-finger nucleic acid-binding protein
MRVCPLDHKDLQVKTYKTVRVDECNVCHGIFFDRGELERAKDNTDPEIAWLDTVLFSLDNPLIVNQQKVTCPACSFAMEPLEYANSGVIINKCANCGGVWLDHGEYAKIISYLENLVQHETAEDLADHMKRQLIEVLVGPKKESEELKELLAVMRLFEKRWVAEHPKIAKLLEIYYEFTPFK